MHAQVDGQPLPPEDVLTMCFTIMLAGLDTTRSALGYIFEHLATHDDDRRYLVENPARLILSPSRSSSASTHCCSRMAGTSRRTSIFTGAR